MKLFSHYSSPNYAYSRVPVSKMYHNCSAVINVITFRDCLHMLHHSKRKGTRPNTRSITFPPSFIDKYAAQELVNAMISHNYRFRWGTHASWPSIFVHTIIMVLFPVFRSVELRSTCVMVFVYLNIATGRLLRRCWFTACFGPKRNNCPFSRTWVTALKKSLQPHQF